MRKQVYVHMLQDLLPIVQKLLESDVPDVYITDDRGGSGSWIIVAQAESLPSICLPMHPHYDWEPVPTYKPYSNGYSLGNMPEEDNDD